MLTFVWIRENFIAKNKEKNGKGKKKKRRGREREENSDPKYAEKERNENI